MPTLNSVNLTSFFQGLNSTDWSDLGLETATYGLKTTFNNHFTVAQRMQDAFDFTDSNDPKIKSEFVNGCYECGAKLTAGWTLDLDAIVNDAGSGDGVNMKVTIDFGGTIGLFQLVRSFKVSFSRG